LYLTGAVIFHCAKAPAKGNSHSGANETAAAITNKPEMHTEIICLMLQCQVARIRFEDHFKNLIQL
jgi:hypothetical protein